MARTNVKLDVVDKSVQIARFDIKDAKELQFEYLVRASKVEESHLIQFKVTGNFVEFDFLIDGRQNPEKIYLGSSGVCPAYIPFRLENRPVVPISQGSARIRRPPARQSSESEKSSGSGGGGGNRN